MSSSGPASSSSSPPASLSSVLQTLHSTYTQQQEAATAPTFQFATPPPPFPTVDLPSPNNVSTTHNVVAPSLLASLEQHSSRAPPVILYLCFQVPVSPLEAPAPLPDALGPLSPSPTEQQEEGAAMALGEQEVEVGASQPSAAAPVAALANPSDTQDPPPAGAVPGETLPPAPEAAAPSSGPSRQPDFSAILGDLDIPEGVDPSFLAALPEDMRAEVIEEQRRLVRARQAPAPPPAAPTGQVKVITGHIATCC